MEYNFKNKKEQINCLINFINDMANFRIHNENGQDWEEFRDLGFSEVEDQLSGISGYKINGVIVNCTFSALVDGLSIEEMKEVQGGLIYSEWKLGDDWHYIRCK